MGVAAHVLGFVPRPAFGLGLESVIAIVQIQLGAADAGRTAAEGDDRLIDFPDSPLTAVRLEALDQNSKRATGIAGRALGTKHTGAKATPAVFHPVQVFRRAQLAEKFIFQAPSL